MVPPGGAGVTRPSACYPPEVSKSQLFRAHSRNTAALKPARRRLSNTRWVYSGFSLPARTRESSRSRRRAARRDERLASFVASRPGTRLESEGRGWGYPVSASLAGMRADVRYEAAGCPLG